MRQTGPGPSPCHAENNGSRPAQELAARDAQAFGTQPFSEVVMSAFVSAGARVFDGERALGEVDVRVVDERVAAVGASRSARR